jgi:AGCS family alanine or glycine:cation symporter
MSKQKYTLLVFAIIGILLLSPGIGVEFYDKVWSFPGNLLSDEFKNSFPIASIPLMVIALLGTGVYMTFKLGFPQLKHVLHGIRVTRGDYDDVEDDGDLNHFKALSTALAATVGIGNIAGVAIAIYYGGPGALFWMWITAFFGTALKYSECTLALQYRETDKFGNTAGGPMYTIENGLGPQWRWLAVTFAAFAVICSFFTGNAIQSFTLTDQLYSQFLPVLGSTHPIMAKSVIIPGILEPSLLQIILGIILAFIVGSVILGGIKRIGNVTGIPCSYYGNNLCFHCFVYCFKQL